MTVTLNPFTGELVPVGSGVPGPVGPQGPPGEPGPAGGTYRHVQGTSASTWEIAHNLGYFPGGIRVRDSGGDLHEGRIVYVDANNLTVSFFVGGMPVSFSGEAFIS